MSATPVGGFPHASSTGSVVEPALPPRTTWAQLALGLLVFVVGGLVVLLVAGSFGGPGVVVALALEAVAVVALWRWSPA